MSPEKLLEKETNLQRLSLACKYQLDRLSLSDLVDIYLAGHPERHVSDVHKLVLEDISMRLLPYIVARCSLNHLSVEWKECLDEHPQYQDN